MKIFISFLLLAYSTNKAFALSDACPENLVRVETSSFYTQEDKINLLCELENKVRSHYSGNLLPGFSDAATGLFQNCYDMVSQTGNFSEDVNGLVLSCISQFNNGHLGAFIKKAPYVFLPFSIIETPKGIFVKSRLRIGGCSDQSLIEVGDKIISINGVSVGELIDLLESYHSASSGGRKRSDSLYSFSFRNFALPDNGQIEVVIQRGSEELNVRSYYSFYENHIDSKTKSRFLTKNYKSCIQQKSPEIEYFGYYLSRPIYEADWAVHATENESTAPFASFSKVNVTADKEACYFNLNTFYQTEGYIDGSSQKTNFIERLENEVAACKQSGKPLIIDFRFNEGGDYAHLISFVNLLTPRNLPLLDSFRSVRLEHDLMGRYACSGEVYYEQGVPLDIDSYSVTFCRTFYSQSKWENGYENEIIILTTSNCMSSCDIAVSALSILPNVTTIGTPTHGAFNGISVVQQEPSNEEAVKSALSFKADDVLTFFAMNRETGSDGEICLDAFGVCYVPLEGDAIEPEITYEVSYDDLVSVPFGAGLRAKIAEVLSGESVRSVPLQ